jgi:hypothetical protein
LLVVISASTFAPSAISDGMETTRPSGSAATSFLYVKP